MKVLLSVLAGLVAVSAPLAASAHEERGGWDRDNRGGWDHNDRGGWDHQRWDRGHDGEWREHDRGYERTHWVDRFEGRSRCFYRNEAYRTYYGRIAYHRVQVCHR